MISPLLLQQERVFMLKKKEGYDKLSLLPFPNLTAERGCAL